MGGARKRRQEASETRSRESVEAEKIGAESLRGELQKRREIVGAGLPEAIESTRTGAMNLRTTGGVTPIDIDTTGRGFEGYEEFAKTGGFTPGESENFLRRATAPTAAIYGANKDELSRQKALQGGYSPGFGASEARLTRQAGIAGSEASLTGNLELNKQIREGKLEGLGGMERIRREAEKERLGKQELQQRGEIAGQELLQRFSQFGVAALSDVDVNELRNRLQSGQMSQADAQLLRDLAAQDKTLFDKVMQGIGTAGGAAAGILAAV